MPRYGYKCPSHGEFDRIAKRDDSSQPQPCPDCGVPSPRKYHAVTDIWKTGGAHKTDYPKRNIGTGTKADILNKKWSKATGEAPPPPAKD